MYEYSRRRTIKTAENWGLSPQIYTARYRAGNYLNYDHFLFIKYYSIWRYSMFYLFFFKSGFIPCTDIVNKICAIQTIGQAVGIRLTTLI